MDCIQTPKETDTSMIEWAKQELEFFCGRKLNPDDTIYNNVIELIETFAKQGNNGRTKEVVIDFFSRLLKKELLGNLHYSDDEFEHNDVYKCYWNKRAHSIIRTADGNYRNLNAYHLTVTDTIQEGGIYTCEEKEECVQEVYEYEIISYNLIATGRKIVGCDLKPSKIIDCYYYTLPEPIELKTKKVIPLERYFPPLYFAEKSSLDSLLEKYDVVSNVVPSLEGISLSALSRKI